MPFAYRSWLTPLQSKLPNALALLLALVCGALLARLVWQLWPQTHDSPTPMQATPAELADTSPSHAVNIANRHLFGITPPSAKPTSAAPSAVPLPNISLLGVITLSPKMAIIAVNNQEKVYSIGDTLKPSSAELVGIEAEAITLKYNGRKQTIKLRKPHDRATVTNAIPEQMGNLSAGMAIMMPPPQNVPDIPPEAGLPSAEILPEMQIPNANTTTAPNAALAQFQKEVMANPNKFMDLVAPPSPVMKDGKMLGFRIMPGKNIALFNQTGLQPGDIVTKVNGTTMDSAGAGMQALQNSMNGGGSLSLEVDRGGQSTPISINF